MVMTLTTTLTCKGGGVGVNRYIYLILTGVFIFSIYYYHLMSSRTVIRRFTTQINTFSKMSANQSHATNSQTQSAVPNAVQNAAPESVERALPDSVSLNPSILILHIMGFPLYYLVISHPHLCFHHPSTR
jgi:hypothetical protein